jgi:penicillin-binding protein 1A
MAEQNTSSPTGQDQKAPASEPAGRSLPNRLRLAAYGGLVLAVIFVGWLGWLYLYELPSFSQLREFKPQLVTRLYARDGSTFQEYFLQRRILVPYDRIPPYLMDALISAEDRNFFSHWGFDLRGFSRALAVNLLSGSIEQGGSTVTQQLARMLFLNRAQTIERKIKEVLTAIKIERAYSKTEILEIYLNQYYFGHGAYGIQAASQVYFSKDAQDINIQEAAMLVGLLQAPSRLNPYRDLGRATARRNTVLSMMAHAGNLDQPLSDSLMNHPIELTPRVEEQGSGRYFSEMVRRYLENKYGVDALYGSGLQVHTTLDLAAQQQAEAIIAENLTSLQGWFESNHDSTDTLATVLDTVEIEAEDGSKHWDTVRVYKQLQIAFVALDNATGDIVAMVGGRDFDKSKFNRVVQANRQSGSAFKPIVYTAAIDNGFKPTDIFYDSPIVLTLGGKEWRPHNYDNKFLGPMTLREGLAGSRNLVAIKLMGADRTDHAITPEQAIFYARRMGITTPLAPYPSLAIGAGDVVPLEITAAYTVFPNGGILVKPRYITKITDRNGSLLEQNTPQREEVLSAQTAYIMTTMLQSVVDEGTAGSARWRFGLRWPAGGKTGTTDYAVDTWFIGFTPLITCGVWIGFDDKTSTGDTRSGSTNALPVWAQFLKSYHEGKAYRDFEPPAGISFVNVCLESGELASEHCVKTRLEVYREENEPTILCSLHADGKRPDDPFRNNRKKDDKRIHF